MSGGSWDYFTFACDDIADSLKGEQDPLRRALGVHMDLVAKAMHDIEWHDSGDISSGYEVASIRNVLGSECDAAQIELLIRDGRDVIDGLRKLGVRDDDRND